MANRCEGLPTGACPEKRQDKTVKFGIYDLFLCKSCENIRDAEAVTRATPVLEEVNIKKSSKQAVKKLVECKAGGTSSKTPSIQLASINANPPVDDLTASSIRDRVEGVHLPVLSSSLSYIKDVKRLVVSELLTYVSYYRLNSNAEALVKVVVTHFSHEEIAEVKRLLVGEL
jgi:hypothetical protein